MGRLAAYLNAPLCPGAARVGTFNLLMARVVIAIGSNLGDRVANLQRAVQLLPLTNLRISSLYETAPMYVEDQPPFLNGAIAGTCEMSPLQLLSRLKEIENIVGRMPRERFGPREIDLDLIAYGSLHYVSPNLELPHPRIAERRFVLQPLQDLDTELRLPGLPPLEVMLCATENQADQINKFSRQLSLP